MGQRLELHALLTELLGSSQVYFQPPPNAQMVYPCIIYERESTEVQHADNIPYIQTARYQVTVVDADPDSLIPAKVQNLPACTHDRSYAVSGLNHSVFTLYF